MYIFVNCNFSKIDYSGSRDSLHPCPEAALCFTRGEILELVVTEDEHWWQARSLGHGSFAALPSGSGGRQFCLQLLFIIFVIA